MGARRFGQVNWVGLSTLTMREIRRFTSVWSQTILAPMATAALFMLVFSLALASRRGEVMGVSFTAFLAPGILMMTVIQNAFANTSSSIMIAKVQGNIVDTLMPPLSPAEILAGYVAGGVARGLFVALTVGAVIFPVAGVGIAAPHWALIFAFLGSLIFALTGIAAAILAEKFDHMSAITNFIVTPLSFLSGTFYSISVLPETMQRLSAANPVFYLIDGFRHGILGTSDASPWIGLVLSLVVAGGLWLLCWRWLARGFRLKS
ncbi:MAG: ABC transporter permease [Pseudomonadota bacterium]